MPFNLGAFVLAVSTSAVVSLGFVADAITTVDEKTKVPLFIVVSFGVAVWRSGVWLTKKFDALEFHLAEQDKQVSALAGKFAGLTCQKEGECPRHEGKHK